MNGLSLTAVIGSGVAIIGLIINMMRAGKDTAARNIEEGKRQQILVTLVKDVENLYSKIRHVEEEYNGLRDDIIEMKSDIKHIVQKVDAMNGRH